MISRLRRRIYSAAKSDVHPALGPQIEAEMPLRANVFPFCLA
jgi:hypothetical protein